MRNIVNVGYDSTNYYVIETATTKLLEVKQQGARLIVLEHQVSAIPALRRYMKPEYHYREITLDDNVTISVAQSRAFLRGVGIDGEIIATPGHSDDSVTLILDAGMAFTGDLPPLHMADDDGGALADSWAQIRARKVQTIYPGHGPMHPLRAEGTDQ